MDTDLFLVIGVVIAALAIPSLLSAWVEGRVPRAGSVMVLSSGGLIATALTQRASGYSFAELPGVFVSVIGRYLN